MDRVLVIEDSRVVLAKLRARIEKKLHVTCDCADSLEAAKKFLETAESPYLAAVVDVCLPDAQDGEAVQFVAAKSIPVVVFTVSLDPELRSSMWRFRVADYVLKEGDVDINYIVDLIERIRRNRQVEALVVEDGSTFRMHISQLLRIHQYKVHEARDGESALAIMNENNSISLMIADHTMPGMTGAELVRTLRKTRPKDDLIIIGMSSSDDPNLDAQFLKHGANDFLHKPFTNEQFYCRINQNMDMLDLVQQMRETSNRDYLTGLYNRRYLLEAGRKMYQAALDSGTPFFVAMLDIDKFKSVNDTYGHETGDKVIIHVANILKSKFGREELVSRMGGEEFCILTGSIDAASAHDRFESLRGAIDTNVETPAGTVPVTASIGLCLAAQDSLESMIAYADERLYEAKEGGRNRVAG